MDYYRLMFNEKIKNPIHIEGLDTNFYKPNCSHEEYEQIPDGMVSYYDYSDFIEFTDLVKHPTMLVSDRLREVLCMYEPSIKHKSLISFPFDKNNNLTPEFFMLEFPEVECLADSVQVNPNGALKELILVKSKISGADIFKVQGTLENYVIVSTAVVESILRRQLCGVSFQKVRTV